MAIADQLAQIILPKRKLTSKSLTPTYNPRNDKLTAPLYREHTTDLVNSRTGSDSRALLNDLVNHDPDISAAVHAYLTIAGSADIVVQAYNDAGDIDPEGITLAHKILSNLTTTNDYSAFSSKPSLHSLTTDLKYMALLRGMVSAELVFDKKYAPTEFRVVDPSSLEWQEKKAGVYTPVQKSQNEEIDLNIPSFFVSRFHQNPTSPYSYSPFVSAINTVVARQDIINELYRIMQVTGYPRMDVEVLENVLFENAPPAIKADIDEQRKHVRAEIAGIQSALQSLTARDAFIHSNAIKANIINDKNPSAGLQIDRVIQVLDNQNQAALKVMPAVVGKSTSVNTASTEARLFAMSADALNATVADILTKALTLAVRLAGYTGRVQLFFRPVELRPVLELEPQLTMKGSRLRTELSLGLITDDEYHLQMFGRPRPASAPLLQGTNFIDAQAATLDPSSISPNDDPLGRSLAPEGSESAASNTVR